MPVKVLVTGSSGLIGRHLVPILRRHADVSTYDIRPAANELSRDVCDADALGAAMAEVDGVVHLAAVSRVVWGEVDPARCRRTNVEGTRNVIRLASAARRKPWIVFASSREVYGQQDTLPVREDATLQPTNVYAQTKVLGEQMIEAAGRDGIPTAIVRFSSVYSDADDHPDRVVPAFCRAALADAPLRVEGSDNCLDLTAVADVVDALARIVDMLDRTREPLPHLHLVSGQGTTLRELAESVIRLSGSRSAWFEKTARAYDVARFVGDPARAKEILGWRATTAPEQGLSVLLENLKASAGQHA